MPILGVDYVEVHMVPYPPFSDTVPQRWDLTANQGKGSNPLQPLDELYLAGIHLIETPVFPRVEQHVMNVSIGG
jgi:hypothetical protein